jgi:[acyl-carrier-protein] S-malonyltransferase
VISGEMVAVEKPVKMKAAGAKRALILPVGGAFHSNDGTSKRRVRSSY